MRAGIWRTLRIMSSYEQFVDLVTEYISQVDGRVLERLRQIHLEREEEEKQKIRKQYQKE